MFARRAYRLRTLPYRLADDLTGRQVLGQQPFLHLARMLSLVVLIGLR
jgi:hypothetical protein